MRGLEESKELDCELAGNPAVLLRERRLARALLRGVELPMLLASASSSNDCRYIVARRDAPIEPELDDARAVLTRDWPKDMERPAVAAL